MTTRELPIAEWPRLDGTLLEGSWRTFDVDTTHIVVVEDGPRIVGCWALFSAWHLEGCWIDPCYRHGVSVGRSGLTFMRRLLASLGIGEVLAMATNERTGRMCQKLGIATHLECAHYSIKV